MVARNDYKPIDYKEAKTDDPVTVNNMVRPDEHDEYIKLQERYRMALKTAAYFRDEYNKLYDWLNDKYTDILNEFNESA